ncbi:YidC/Oxa1 family membrane protein insertase [Patescibacteria group bacterium]|jgi:YidC/Oxa1 family membrane protein insertase|nr:YidC/Oxa1 family membrane protein insertase [Patescibacteria group bacterium]
MIANLFNTIFFQPILNLLVWLYVTIPGQDIGIAIILLTIIVKVVLYPLTHLQIKQQRSMQELQPKIEEIRQRLKDDKEKQASELMALYKTEKVNPASSCLPLLLQLPIFLALFHALQVGLKSEGLNMLYPFVANPQTINAMFLGLFDLTQPNYVLAILAGLVQFWQTRQILKPPAATVTPPPPELANKEGAKDESMTAIMNKQMTYMMPIMTIVIGFSLPGGLTLYWLVMSLLTVAQQSLVLKRTPPKIGLQLK